MEFVETIVIDAYLPTVSTIYSQEGYVRLFL